MSNEPIRIMLVDDHQLVRESWKMLLENNPRFHVVADCDNGNTALEQLQLLRPDIMLIDINMSPINGFDITRRIIETMPQARIIGLSVHNQPKYATRMMELGARGFLTKTSPMEEINEGILAVHRGEYYICEEIRRNLPPSE
ncbi:MAG: response regulator transcription factor [Chitinophagaceae bacterium]|nr:response regulator transcription factor [Chitinophagaceae bacterium]